MAFKRIRFLLIFILLLYLVCRLLVSPRVDRFFYPYPAPYREYIEEYGEKYQVDPLFIAAVVQSESSFDPEAVSSRGQGLMQLCRLPPNGWPGCWVLTSRAGRSSLSPA